MKVDLEKIADWITWIITGASIGRIGLHYIRQLPILLYLIPDTPESNFWKFYTALELTTAYVAVSLAAFGHQKPSATPIAPIAESLSSGEGQIKP